MVYLKEFFEKVDFEKKKRADEKISMKNYQVGKEVRQFFSRGGMNGNCYWNSMSMINTQAISLGPKVHPCRKELYVYFFFIHTVLVFNLTLCHWEIFSGFFCRLLIFLKIYFFEKFFQEYNQSVKQFESRSGLRFCWTIVCKSY